MTKFTKPEAELAGRVAELEKRLDLIGQAMLELCNAAENLLLLIMEVHPDAAGLDLEEQPSSLH